MATDRQGATVAVGDVYLLAGKVVRIEGTRVLVRDASGKLRHVEAAEIAKVDGALGGHGHDIDDVTDLGAEIDAINFALTGKAATSHTHGAADVTSGTMAAARLPAATTTTQGAVELATDGESVAGVVVQGNDARLSNARTPTSHTHGASDITSGTVAVARLPAATTTTQGIVELATSGESAANVVVQGNDARLSDTRVPKAHTHDASDIASGTVAVARLPAATTSAQGIVELATSGENAANVVVQGNDSRLSDARTPTAHTHNASDINAGTLGAARLPALSGAVTSSAGSATTSFGAFKANAILMNMTNASGVPTAVDGTDAAANMWAFLGGSYLLPAWNLATAQLGSIAI